MYFAFFQTNRLIAVLACSGRVLRLIEHCRVRQTVELDSVPTVLYVPNKSYGDRLLCGHADGKVTLIQINHFGMDGKGQRHRGRRVNRVGRMTEHHCVVNEQVLIKADYDASAVTALDMFDMTGEGKDDLIVGRRDGTVQVFSVPADSDADTEEVRQVYSENFQESISSVQGGCVGCNGYVELVISTYTGRVFGLTTQCVKLSLSDNASASAASLSVDMRSRISRLK